MNILYVEDNPGDADLTRRELRRHPDMKVEVVSTVAAGLARLADVAAAAARGEAPSVDLALLDMHLPDGSGLGVLAEIRGKSLPIAAVVLTGSGDEESVLSALRAGADDYLPKRHDYWSQLPGILRSALESFRGKAAMRRSPIRVLCAEHNRADVELMARLFAAKAPFIRVDFVRAGGDLLERLPASGPVSSVDVLLVDFRLPDMNALELLKEIHQVRRLDVPVIVNTGLGSEDVALQALKLGAADYMVKSPGYLERLPLVIENTHFRRIAEREGVALRESEGRLRAIIETSPECVLVLGEDGAILKTNPAGLSMLQARTVADLDGVPFESLVRPESKEAFRALFREVSSGRASTLEFRVRGLAGEERWADLHAAPMPGPGGGGVQFLGILRDISERKRNEESLRQTQKMNAFGQLAGGVAHDFNNQLGAIMGYAELLAARLAEPELKRYVGSIEKAARRSAELTRNLLTFARQVPSETVPLDVHSLVGEIMDLLERTIDKRIVVSARLSAESALILGDPSLVQNALLNLALNARDAMPEGGTLLFSTECVLAGPAPAGEDDGVTLLRDPSLELPGGRYLHVSVSDTGMGMTEEVRQRIFEPFFTTKPVGKGTGMGLASVFGTVKLHRGAITLDTAPGVGTSFHVYLPLTGDAAGAGAPAPVSRPKAGRIGVLVVDDEPMLRELLADLLIQEGHTVFTAGDGREAVKVYRSASDRIDLVLLDMVMPEMGGRETYRALREIRPDVRVLLSSGYTPADEIQGIMAEGILGVLHKPYSTTLLEEAIVKAMSARDP